MPAVARQNNCVARQKFKPYYKAVIASKPQNIVIVQYSRRTHKLVILAYCTQPIFCGIDAMTDNYRMGKIFSILVIIVY